MKRVRLSCAALLSLLLALALSHAALAAGEGAKLADLYLKKQPAPALDPAPTLEQAMKIQAEYVAAIMPAYGRVIGYKAGLTNPSVQKAIEHGLAERSGSSGDHQNTVIKHAIAP